MIGYTTLGVKDLDKAKTFYSELFADKGAKVQVDVGRLAMIGTSLSEPMISVCVPHNEQAPSVGNGTMVAFRADSKDNVGEMYNKPSRSARHVTESRDSVSKINFTALMSAIWTAISSASLSLAKPRKA